MTRSVQTLALGFALGALAAVFPPPATATCDPAGASASRVIAARIAAGRDDVTVRQEQPLGDLRHLVQEAEKRVAARSGDEKKLISTVTPLASKYADASGKGEGESLSSLLEKEYATVAELRAVNAQLRLALRRRREAPSAASMTSTVSAALSPCTAPAMVAHLSLSDDEREALSMKLVKAAEGANLNEIRRLLAQGADVGYSNEQRETALHWAARNSHAEAVRLLIDRGAPVDARTSYTYAPMNWAGHNGCAACVEALAAAGATIDTRSSDGWTPLHDAAYYNHEKTVRALLAAGADPGIRDNQRKTPREYTTSNAIRALLPQYE